jgi:hypothetical protein
VFSAALQKSQKNCSTQREMISRTIPDCVCVRHLVTYAAAAALSPR